jgi:spore coat protein U-like protein
MKKYILGFGLPLAALALMSFTTSSSTQESLAAAGGIKITCPEGDQYTCYEGDGFKVFKGTGNATIEL